MNGLRAVVLSMLITSCSVSQPTRAASVQGHQDDTPQSLVTQGTRAATLDVSPQGFSTADVDGKRRILGELVISASPIPADSISRIIQLGLRDPAAQVRTQALLTIAGRAGGLRFAMATSAQEQKTALKRWQQEHMFLKEVRKAIEDSVVNDTDQRVRKAGIMALANLDFDPSRSVSVSTFSDGAPSTIIDGPPA